MRDQLHPWTINIGCSCGRECATFDGGQHTEGNYVGRQLSTQCQSQLGEASRSSWRPYRGNVHEGRNECTGVRKRAVILTEMEKTVLSEKRMDKGSVDGVLCC